MNILPLRVAVAGHVDHGKSTLIGRLLSDTGQVTLDKMNKVRGVCETTGGRFEYAFLLDALEEEQQQGITIDVTEVSWRYRERAFTIIDTPGHREFLKNMVGGASRADAAILVVDVQEGVKEHFRRQVAVMGLLNISKIVVVLNKMDLASWSEDLFSKRQGEIEQLFVDNEMSLPQIVPVAAWNGVNLLAPSDEMPWYPGPYLAQILSDLPPSAPRSEQPLRFPIQDTYKFGEKRIYAGRVEAGELRVGETLRFLPNGRESLVKSIEVFGEPTRAYALPGEAVGITLEEPLFLQRGDIGFSPRQAPRVSRVLLVDIFWLSSNPLAVGNTYGFRCANAELTARVEGIDRLVIAEPMAEPGGACLEAGQIARISLSLDKPLAHDLFRDCEVTGRFVLIEDFRVVGGGRILADHHVHLSNEQSFVTTGQRQLRFGHSGFTLWMTGLSGAGKSTVARELERQLFAQGANVVVLDGDNVRQGLSSDLGFSDADRSENIRRVAEVSALFVQMGAIVVTALVSPFAVDRERARQIIGNENFVEIFVDCPISECERRDPKGLYAQARKGDVKLFTGFHSRYEPPSLADIHIETDRLTSSEAVKIILDRLRVTEHRLKGFLRP